MAQSSFVLETQTIRKMAADPACKWKWTKHAFERMAEFQPSVTQPDIENALMNGQVILAEYLKDELWRVRGPDLDGQMITVVVAPHSQPLRIKVITVF